MKDEKEQKQLGSAKNLPHISIEKIPLRALGYVRVENLTREKINIQKQQNC